MIFRNKAILSLVLLFGFTTHHAWGMAGNLLSVLQYPANLDQDIVKIACDNASNDIKNLNTMLKTYPNRSLHKKQYLFVGPVGSGKKTIAQAIAQDAGWSSALIRTGLLSRDLLNNEEEILTNAIDHILRNKTKCIIIFDYVTIMASKRHSERNISVTMSALLDRCNTRNDIVVVGTTNDASDLDAQVASRLDSGINIPLPTVNTREALMNHLFENALLAGSIDHQYIEMLAYKTKGQTFRDIINFSEQVADHAASENREMERSDFEAIIQTWKKWYHPTELYLTCRPYVDNGIKTLPYVIPPAISLIGLCLSLYQYKALKQYSKK